MFHGSRRLLAVALFSALLIIAVNLAWWLFYDRSERLLDAQLSRRLAAVATVTAGSLGPELTDALILGDLGAFMDVTRVLDQSRRADSLAEVFILDDGYRYLASTSHTQDSVYFLTGLNAACIDSVLFGTENRAVVTPAYRTGSIVLRSAFAPIHGSDEAVAAVLGVEASVDYFDSLADLKVNLYYSTAASIAGGLVFGLLFLLVQRRLNAVQNRLFMNETHAYLGRMVAVVSHEIKNPLMIIRASAERLARKQQSEESEFIVEEVDRLNQIVNGYLDFARGSSGQTPETETPGKIDLASYLATIRNHFRDKYPDHEVNWLEGSIRSDLKLIGRPRQLRQVILNLLINGAEACLAASLPISVGISAIDKGDRVILAVIDRGPGMTPKEARRAFEPFYTTRQSGSGLGLYLCKRLIEEMGGGIEIQAKPGNGTEIVIDLPKTPRT